jgi:ABC-type lipoprotein export system ATPase subunit
VTTAVGAPQRVDVSGGEEPMVQLRDVFCVHRTSEGDAAALQGATLEVARGELLCVLGPSGAGKSTLLRVIGGLQTPSAGIVRVLGRDIGRLSGRARARIRHDAIGFLSQHADASVAPDLRIRDVVALPLALRAVERSAARARVDELLDAAGLGDRAQARPGELSGGERQRVAVCASLAHRPSLLLADEPTGELDAASAEAVRALISELARAHGTTAIVVSHDPATAEFADRSVRLRDGRVAEDRRGGDGALVVGAGGWLQLPPELLRDAGIGDRARVRPGPDGGLLVTPAGPGTLPGESRSQLEHMGPTGEPQAPLEGTGPAGEPRSPLERSGPVCESRSPLERSRPAGGSRSPLERSRPAGGSRSPLERSGPAGGQESGGGWEPTLVGVRSLRRDRGRGAGRRRVLDGFDRQFAAGRMTAITGRSGSGKTTLLRLLAGIDAPDEGLVSLDAVALGSLGAEARASLRRERIGYLSQEPAPVAFLSAEENIVLALRLRGWDTAAAARRATVVLSWVGLAERARQRVARLSAGETQRVALARALASARGLLIVDEPTSRLDEAGATTIAELLAAAAAQDRQTVICATHDPQVIRHADEVVPLEPLRSS